MQYVYQLCCIRNGRYPDVLDIASTTIILQEGAVPNDLSDKSWIDSAEDAPLNNSSETQNNDNNNNTDMEE